MVGHFSTLLTKYYRLLLVAILAFSFFTKIYNLHLPTTYIFDEVYHAITAKLIARNDPMAYEWWNPPVEPNTSVDWLHPPYAKYTQATGILLFGETSFGWRISSVLFGVMVTAAVFKLADLLFESKSLALTAAFISSLDGLLLVQSRIAMNDIHVTFFILLTMICYVSYLHRHRPYLWLFLTGISAGLAVGSKWSGVYILGLVGLCEAGHLIHLAWIEVNRPRLDLLPLIKRLLMTVACLVVIPILLYLAAYSHMFWQGKDFKHFADLHQQIWWYQTNLEATHGYQSRPWQWFLNLRPVWYHVEYAPETIANIYAFGNPAVSWAGVITVLLSFAYLGWRLYTKQKPAWSLILLMASYLIVWAPWQFSPRIMFYYHYTPAVPFLAIMISFWLRKMWRSGYRWLVGLVLITMVATFVIWYPHWTNQPVPTDFANRVYFAVSTWK